MDLDPRLVKYFVAVAQAGNVTRAAERLHISQPALSAAVKQLERQLGVALRERVGRGFELTPAGELLLARGLALLEHAGAVADEVRGRGADEPAARLRFGLSPTARYGVAPALPVACAAAPPAVMLYASEDTTATLLRDAAGPPRPRRRLLRAAGRARRRRAPARRTSRDPPAGATPVAERATLTLDDLADETILIAGGRESAGFTDRVPGAFAAAGLKPRTAPGPYPTSACAPCAKASASSSTSAARSRRSCRARRSSRWTPPAAAVSSRLAHGRTHARARRGPRRRRSEPEGSGRNSWAW
jgi:DNA-binding transcriptional LysR family regulator